MARLTLAALLLPLLLAACGKGTPEVEPAPPSLTLEPVAWQALEGWDEDDPSRALGAFRRSCALLQRRSDTEAVGRQPAFGMVADWRGVCARAQNPALADAAAARTFFTSEMVPLAASDGGEATGLFTGYYEPLLLGARRPDSRFKEPLHGRPADLVEVDLGRFDSELEGRRIAGRVVSGRLQPFPSRAEIEKGALDGQGLELLWVDDAIAKFFLQIQGSGQVQLADGSHVRVGYAAQNGRPYRAIGRDLIEMGALTREQVSLQTIRDWLAANPGQADAVMDKNPSYVFFRELPELALADGPLGAQNVPLTPGRSLAVDRRFLPLGIPVWLEASEPTPEGERPLRRLVITQDTGGAIRGPVRGDLFWGAGPAAEYAAGHMKSSGRYFLLVPRSLAPAS